MFAGVGRSHHDAKHANQLWSVRWTPPRCRGHMKENIRLNKVTTVVPLEGVPSELLRNSMRRSHHQTCRIPRGILRRRLTKLNMGGTIHLYIICEDE